MCKRLLYWRFLNPSCDSIFRALGLCFFDKRFSNRGPQWVTAPPWVAPDGHFPNLLIARFSSDWRLTICSWVRVYIISYHLCVPVVLSAVNPRDLLTLTHHVFSGNHFVNTPGTSCPSNLWLTALSRSICHTYLEIIMTISCLKPYNCSLLVLRLLGRVYIE